MYDICGKDLVLCDNIWLLLSACRVSCQHILWQPATPCAVRPCKGQLVWTACSLLMLTRPARLQLRGYAVKEGRALRVTSRGRMVSTYLVHYFPKYVDYNFTSDMEAKLDEIAGKSLLQCQACSVQLCTVPCSLLPRLHSSSLERWIATA